MNEVDGEERDGSAANVTLECGHRLTLPWGLAPVAAAAELLHHRTVCDSEPWADRAGGVLAMPPAWLPLPGAPR